MENLILLQSQIKANKDEKEIILGALEKLEKVSVTKDLLKKTGLGKTIATLSAKTPFPDVKQKSKSLLEVWKQSISKKEIKKVEKIESDENLDYDDRVREQAYKVFLSVFQSDKDENQAKQSISKGIEQALFDMFNRDSADKNYKAKVRSLKFNLSKNEELRLSLLRGEVIPTDIVKMSAEQLASTAKKEANEIEKTKLFNESRSDWLESNRDNINKQAGIAEVGGLFACEECKSTKTTHYQKQTRGADEPMTVFAQCTECGYNWRFGDH